jgi:cystathionine beta-lyase
MSKAESGKPAHTDLKPDTKVTVGGRTPHAHHGYVNPPVYHASTLLYRTAEEYLDGKGPYHYGRRGTPTSEALEKAIQEIEGPDCADVALLPSGLAAISTALLSVLRSSDHVLMTDSAYGPARTFCDTVLTRYGVTTSYYNPLIGGDIGALMQPNTRAVYTEAPGSLTFEMQDIPAIAEAAHNNGALVLMDNTWAGPLYFKALEKGVDLSIQSGSKYIGGHCDLMLGTVSANKATAQRLKDTVYTMGLCVGPDDMNLGLRGVRTLAVRLRRPRNLEARFFRRQRTLQCRAEAHAREGRAGLPQRAHALRHRRILGRLRESRHPGRCKRLPDRDEIRAGRTRGPFPYRARGRKRPHRRSRARLRGAEGGGVGGDGQAARAALRSWYTK